jgi:hypothetical protein
MLYTVNTTKEYHTQNLKTLGWELTVCNALDAPESPCRKILKRDGTYGRLLYDYLKQFIPMGKIQNILEVGGGYGCLMRDFLNLQPGLNVTMLDISPLLLERQRQCLRDHHVRYLEQDFLDVAPSFLQAFDLVLLNENLGDFPTALDVSTDIFMDDPADLPPLLRRLLDIFDRYGFNKPEQKLFHVNIGAIEALEKLCGAAVPALFLSEHSCEASGAPVPAADPRTQPTGNPERIALKGHDEYTIKFSYLVDIARHYHYNVVRGPMADYIEPNFTDRVRAIVRSHFSANDEHEIIRQFIEDLYKYEYLILTKKEEAL